MARVNPQYQAAIEQIKIDADNYADEQMRTTYKNQKDHLTELHKFIGLLYIKYAVDGLLSKLTLQQKKAITGSVDSTLKAMAKDMGQTQVDNITAILKHNYSDTYYKNAYVMDSGLKVNLKFDILKDEYINAAVNNPIDGEIFSKRIWNNTADVADKLKQSIIDAMNGDTTIDAVGKNIQEIFNVNAYNAMRLVNTENARVQSQAIDDIAASTGVKKQIYSATLDNKTSEECAALDGHPFDVDDPDKVVPPENHPNCRCVLINVPFDGWQPSKRKDNDSKDIIDYENYNDWLNNKVNNSGNDTNIKNNDIINQEELLPNLGNAIIPEPKVKGYALNMDHPTGKDKAIAFEKALGYNQENADDLIKNIQDNISNYKATFKDETQYGKRYEVVMNLKGPNGKTANVLTAWIVKNGDDFPSLTSVYVTKKKVK